VSLFCGLFEPYYSDTVIAFNAADILCQRFFVDYHLLFYRRGMDKGQLASLPIGVAYMSDVESLGRAIEADNIAVIDKMLPGGDFLLGDVVIFETAEVFLCSADLLHKRGIFPELAV
jgi:hypothetical protein